MNGMNMDSVDDVSEYMFRPVLMIEGPAFASISWEKEDSGLKSQRFVVNQHSIFLNMENKANIEADNTDHAVKTSYSVWDAVCILSSFIDTLLVLP